MAESQGNREYKSDVFTMLLQDKDNALSLYNAMNESNYKDPELIEICNLEKGVSLSIMNDAAFVIDMNLNIYEHQSTYNPNMPLRSLIYAMDIFKKYIKDKDIYGKKLVRIPTPRFVVFYNGLQNAPERYELKLSDAYIHPAESPQLELICKVININPSNNSTLFAKCKFLFHYMLFVEYVRYYTQELDSLKDAISFSIDRCIQEDILKEFLIEHRSEVEKNMVLDYTFEAREKMIRRDAKEAGIQQGIQQGFQQGRIDMIRTALKSMSEDQVKQILEVTDDEISEAKK